MALVAALGVTPLAIPPAGATRPTATARQLAGSIPSPYIDARDAVKVGNDLFVIDGNAIDRIDVTTSAWAVFAGDRTVSGSVDGYGAAARFNIPQGLATDGDNLYVADSNNDTIRRVRIGNAEVSTIAGQVGLVGSADGAGAAARFNGPKGIVVVPDELSVYIADSYNRTIRKLTLATAAVTTVAGMPGAVGSVDGIGAAARFEFPDGITSDASGVLWIGDGIKLRKLVPSTRAVTTRAAFTDPGAFNQNAMGVAVSGGFVYVAAFYFIDTEDGGEYWKIWKVNAATGGVVDITPPLLQAVDLLTDGVNLWAAHGPRFTEITLATGASRGAAGIAAAGQVDGRGAAARFTNPADTTSDGLNLYVTDRATGAVRKVVIATGAVTTLATGLDQPRGITHDATDLYVAQPDAVARISKATGAVSTLVTLPTASNPAHDLVYQGGHLYLVHGDCAVYDIVIATATMTALAGVPGQCGNQTDGTGAAARFGAGASSPPTSITTDGTNLWIADNRLRKVVIATAVVTTVAAPGTADSLTHAGGSLYVVLDVNGTGRGVYRSDAPGGAYTLVIPDRGQPLTYAPTSASTTAAGDFLWFNGIAADSAGHRLFFANGYGVGMITDAKVPPQLTIGDVTTNEGDGGMAQAVFTVRLSSPQPDLISVVYLTNDGSATSASGDYVGQSGRLDFAPGVVEQRVKVTVNGDMANEANESFKVRLVWPSGGAVLARAIGTATLLDDDPNGGSATLAIGDVSVVEGDDLSALAVFPVRLSSAQGSSVSVNFGTVDGSATLAGGDYEPRLGTLSFAPGVTGATVFVKLTGDYRPEALETFSLVLSGSTGPTITRASGAGAIIDDD